MARQPVGLRRERLEKKARRRKTSSFLGRLLFLFLVGILIFWFGRQLYQFCLFQAIRTVQAQNNVLEDSCVAQGILLLQETVVKTPAAGQLVPLVREGERVRAGRAVARLKKPADLAARNGSLELRSPCPGVVSYNLDGWEGALDAASWERYNLQRLFESMQKDNHSPEQKDFLGAGEPVFKIIDNLINPYLFLKFKNGYNPQYEIGDFVRVTWGNSGTGKMKVLSLVKKEDSFFATGELLSARPFPCCRLMKFKVTSQSSEGVVLPASALVKNKDCVGVFTKTPLGLTFKKVDVVVAMEDRIAVTGVEPGTDIVTNPGLAKKIIKKI